MSSIKFRNPISFLRFGANLTISGASMALGDAYARGDIEIEDITEYLLSKNSPGWRGLIPRKRRHSPVEAEVASTYDLGNEFYEVMLGKTMTYTCGFHYPPDGPNRRQTAGRHTTDSGVRVVGVYEMDRPLGLDEAQAKKNEWHAQRLAGCTRILNCGGGWGGLEISSADIAEKSTLLTISEQQHEWNITRGFNSQQISWNELLPQREYDGFTSICMLEHVGISRVYSKFPGWIAGHLKPGGVGTLQFITRPNGSYMSDWFDARIFPGAYPPDLAIFINSLNRAGIQITELVVRTYDYPITLEGWWENVYSQRDYLQAKCGVDEYFFRLWKFFLSAGQVTFGCGEVKNILRQKSATLVHLAFTRN